MSTDDGSNLDSLSRRKLLGGVATIGGAAAVGGAGTFAFFSDEEEFANNRLVAGSLDLKIDWEEHYVDWLGAEAGVEGVRMVDSADDVNDNEIGVPDTVNPMLAVRTDDSDGNGTSQIDEFQDATSIEAFPDHDNDGTQSIANGGEGNGDGFEPCEDLGDIPDALSSDLRTNGTVDGQTTEAGDPLINLNDVKPGDFGELTLSFHLCDNPGYMWLQGGLVDASENGHTEPELADPDEGDGVELLDEVQTLLWYDEDGDNVHEPGGAQGEADICLVIDRSGSMSGSRIQSAKNAAKSLVDEVGAGAQIGLVSFNNAVTLDHDLSSDTGSVKSAIDSLSTGGTTNIEGAVDAGHEELTGNDISGDITASGNHRSGVQKIMVVLTDGAPNVNGDGNDEPAANYNGDGDTEFAGVDPNDNATAAKNAGIELFTVGLGISETSDSGGLLQAMASDPDNSHAFFGDINQLLNIFSQIALQIAGEEAFFRGTLRELLNLVSTDDGIPLDGARSTEYQEVVGIDPSTNTAERTGASLAIGNESDPNREVYSPSTTNEIGFAWWLPLDHGNEVQTDSVSFDLGFYVEQGRHNDGSGFGNTAT